MNSEPMPLAAPRPPAAGEPPAKRRAAWEGWRLIAALVIGFVLPVAACMALMLTSALAWRIAASGLQPTQRAPTGRGPASGPAVAIIRVEGAIMSGRGGGPFSTSAAAGAETIIEQLRRAQDDRSVRAVLLLVNSPGGGVNASDVIHHAVQGFDKPVVVLMGDLAASGGYYISAPADWIMAHPHSLTGSIGVISEFPNAEELLDNIGVEFEVIKSGERKDFASPYREMTEEERAYWQQIVDDTHADFVRVVAEGRGMPPEQVLPLADGRVFTGRQALELGLVDALGYRDDAIARAAELGGITGEPRVIEMRSEPTFFDLLRQQLSQRPGLPSLAEILGLIGHPSLSARWIGP
jgi:protease IV